jgi:hypothetical protein
LSGPAQTGPVSSNPAPSPGFVGTGQTTITLAKLSADREMYDRINRAYASLPRKVTKDDKMQGPSVASVMTDLPKPTTVSSPPGKLTFDELTKLRDRINDEIARIQTLRSSSPTLQAKLNQLTQIVSDLNNMIDKIIQKKMDIKDVPILGTDANAFLQSLSTDSVSSSLINPTGTAEKYPNVSFVNDPAMQYMNNPNIQSLLENTKYLKWNSISSIFSM